uniref:Uncharacterized protein n=1 Tax=Kalanchoe fedtschenkoi TaxID=63787 RepID=A0A7N0SXH0_KALFE
MDFDGAAPDQWSRELSSYADRLGSLDKPDLIPLDEFYRNELPALIHARSPNPHITAPELVELMKWKLARGKWRPRLLDFVSSLDGEAVVSASRKAFEALPDVSRAVTELTVLKGVGPATAVLAAYAPGVAPFMSDEELSSHEKTFTPSDVERALWSAAIGAELSSPARDRDSSVKSSKSSKRKRK